jgi:metal-responsive CopG/Arc/MetJ family transcriptional regulator
VPRPKKPTAKAVARDWLPVSVKLPSELVRLLDALAQREERPRSKVIEFACRAYVQAHRHKAAAE